MTLSLVCNKFQVTEGTSFYHKVPLQAVMVLLKQVLQFFFFCKNIMGCVYNVLLPPLNFLSVSFLLPSALY